jgi:hypothetical protein
MSLLLLRGVRDAVLLVLIVTVDDVLRAPWAEPDRRRPRPKSAHKDKSDETQP